MFAMKRLSFVCSILMLVALPAYAQKGKAWTDWNQKEAEKVLNDSGWGQTQTEGGSGGGEQPAQTAAISTTTAGRERNATSVSAAATSAQSGETKAAPSLHLRVRF